MSKHFSFDVSLLVSDDVSRQRAQEVLEAMLDDLLQDDNYHDVRVVDGVMGRDDAAGELLDVLGELDHEAIDTAIDSVRALEEEDDE